MDRDELKIKVRDAIWNLDSQATLTGHWEDPSTYAEAALSAIEEAGYVLNEQKWRDIASAPKNESILVFIPNAEHYGPGIYRGVLFDKGTGERWHVSGLHMGRDCGPDTMPIGWLPLPSPPETSDE